MTYRPDVQSVRKMNALNKMLDRVGEAFVAGRRKRTMFS
jgi:hypothetical protein